MVAQNVDSAWDVSEDDLFNHFSAERYELLRTLGELLSDPDQAVRLIAIRVLAASEESAMAHRNACRVNLNTTFACSLHFRRNEDTVRISDRVYPFGMLRLGCYCHTKMPRILCIVLPAHRMCSST